MIRIAVEPGLGQESEPDPWRVATAEARRPWGAVFNGHATRSGPAEEYERLVHGQVSQFYFSTSAVPGLQSGPGEAARRQLWQLVRRDFPSADARAQMQQEQAAGVWRWDWAPGDFRQLAQRCAAAIEDPDLHVAAKKFANTVRDAEGWLQAREEYLSGCVTSRGRRCLSDKDQLRTFQHQLESLRLSIDDLGRTFGTDYARRETFQAELATVEQLAADARERQDAGLFGQACQRLDQLRHDALLANPLLDFQQLLVVKRRANPFLPDLPFNWANNSSLNPAGYDNEIAILAPIGLQGRLKTLYRPSGSRFVGDVDLDFDGQRLLFSMPNESGQWRSRSRWTAAACGN